ncbi:hypothetical protein [Janibacter sp. LM]|jgi:hypothetical protein|uniref:hypothetical protein n=1 Tax=Janibacter sp. LM TaxID=3144845 RepID=UPI0031F6DE2C
MSRHQDTVEDFEVSAGILVDALSDAQVERYVGTRDRSVARRALAADRRRSGSIRPADTELPEAMREELREATEVAEMALGPVWRLWRVVTGTLFTISGWVFLGCGLLAVLTGLVTGGFTRVFRAWDGWRWRFDDVATDSVTGVLLLLSIAGLVLAVLTVLVLGITESLGARRVRPALLDWAAGRPGQLGRGLPALTGSGSLGSVGRRLLVVVLIIGATSAAFAVPVSGVVLLTSLLGFELEWFLTCLAFFAASLLLGWLMLRLGRYLLSDTPERQRTRAFAWRWSEVRDLTHRRRISRS